MNRSTTEFKQKNIEQKDGYSLSQQGDLLNPSRGYGVSPDRFLISRQVHSEDKINGKSFSGRFLVRGFVQTIYASEISIDPMSGGFQYLKTESTNAVVRANSGGSSGQELYLKITNDSTANRVITFGTNFSVTGTLTGSTTASAILHFISDGTKFWEVSRTTGLT